MAFDLKSARPVKSGGFDISTAKPVSENVEKQSELKPLSFYDKAFTALNEAAQIPESFVNTATFGGLDLLKTGMEKIGLPVVSKEPVTPAGKIGKAVGSVAGAIYSPGRVAGAVGRQILPKMALESGLKGNIARTIAAAGEGATFGALMPGSAEERGKQAIAGAVLQPGLKAGIEALEPTSIRIAQGIIKPKGVLAKKSEQIARTALEKGTLRASAQGTAEASQEAISNLMDQVDEIAEASTVDISMKPAFRRAAATAKYWIGEGKPERAQAILQEIQNLAQAKGWTAETSMPAKEYLGARRAQDVVIKKLRPTAFNAPAVSPDIEGRMEFVGGMRKALGQQIPEIGEKNLDISKLIDVVSAAKNRAGVSSRNNILDLMDYGMGTVAAGTGNPLVAAMLLAKKGWQGGKALTARGMYKAAQAIKGFGKQIPESIGGKSEDIYSELGSVQPNQLFPKFEDPKALPFPIPEPQLALPSTVRLQIEKSPIIFGESSQPSKSYSLLKKIGIDPYTGKIKPKKIPSSYQASMLRLKQNKGRIE